MIVDFRFIGIELGSSKAVVSSLNRYNMKIILNEASQRETPFSITYTEDERHFGEKSIMNVKTKSLSTIQSPNRYLTNIQQTLSVEKRFSMTEFENGTYFLKDYKITVKQAIVGFFGYLNQLSKIEAMEIPFFCVSVPNYTNLYVRKELTKCLKATTAHCYVVSEKIAVGLDYYVNVSRQKQNVLFIDFGYAKLSAYVIHLEENQIRQLFEKSLSNLGVRNLDIQLQKQLKKYIGCELNQKKLIRLKQIASKTRSVLSANSQYTVHEEFGEEDLEVKLNRAMFQQICSEHIQKVKEFLTEVKNAVKDTLIHSVEIFGGGSRIPFFQRIVCEVLEIQQTKRSVNSTQSIARGAALYIHRKQRQSKISRISIKQILKHRVYVLINSTNKQRVGQNFKQEQAECLQKHLIYQQNTVDDNRRITFEAARNKDIEIWIYSPEPEIFSQYYFIERNKIEKDTLQAHIDITCKDGYPKIQRISLLKKDRSVKQIEVKYDSQGEINQLIKSEQAFSKKDKEAQANHEKLNYIETHIYKLKETHPQLYELYNQNIKNPAQYDLLIQNIKAAVE